MRLITGLGNAEITTPRNASNAGQASQKPSNVMYGDSEELNRVVVLSLARAIHVHGHEQQSTGWFKVRYFYQNYFSMIIMSKIAIILLGNFDQYYE